MSDRGGDLLEQVLGTNLVATLVDQAGRQGRQQLVALFGILSENAAATFALLHAPAPHRWLTPEEAADHARVTVDQIRLWARRTDSKPWAGGTRETLRIEASAFDAWLGRKGLQLSRVRASGRQKAV